MLSRFFAVPQKRMDKFRFIALFSRGDAMSSPAEKHCFFNVFGRRHGCAPTVNLFDKSKFISEFYWIIISLLHHNAKRKKVKSSALLQTLTA